MESLEAREFLSADHAGNTLKQAHNVATLSSSAQFRDFVGVGDAVDFYKFKISGLKNVNLNVTGTSSKVRLALIRDFNGNGKIESSDVIASAGGRGTSRSISVRLGTGTYFARVMQSAARNNYTLGLNASAIDPGNTLRSAFNVGTLA